MCRSVDVITDRPTGHITDGLLCSRRLNIPGAEHGITSDEALTFDTVPKKVVVIGGGCGARPNT